MDEKRQRDDSIVSSQGEEVSPQWAAQEFSNMNIILTKLVSKIDLMDEKLSGLEAVEERCDEMEEGITKNADGIAALQKDMVDLRAVNADLRDEIIKLKEEKASMKDVAKVTDSTLRSSMTVCGVAKGRDEKYWTGSQKTLALALAELTPANDKDYNYWYYAIERCHRGKSENGKIPVIHTKFKFWGDFDYLMNLFKREVPIVNPKHIEFYEKFHELTVKRRKDVAARRKEIRGENRAIKAYLRYPADLMVKKPGQAKYICVEKF